MYWGGVGHVAVMAVFGKWLCIPELEQELSYSGVE